MSDRPCGFCSEDASDGVVLDVHVGPGPRGPGRVSTVETLVPGYAVCGSCLAGESGRLLAALVDDPWAREVAGSCTVRCHRPRARGVLSRARCPSCFGRVSVESPGTLAPRRPWRSRVLAALGAR